MLIFALDDEPLLLRKLHRTLLEVLPDAQVMDFSRASAALAAIEQERLKPDYVFLDIEMPGMTGMELAREIIRLHSGCAIIFCTSFTQYALDAIHLHAPGYMGYLVKPITAAAVRREIELSGASMRREPLLTARCFGNFEVYSKDQPLAFKRTRSKELLAYLIDRNGAGVTAKQICACLWEDGVSDSKNLNYLYQLFDDLRNALAAVGAEEVLQRRGYSYYVDPSRIRCDYYGYLAEGTPQFRGEYMTQYSWAEETCGLLWRK